MMNMMKKAAFGAGIAVALVGCVTSSGTTYHIDDPYLFFNSAGRAGGFPIVIVGQPYPGRQPGVEAAVVNAFSSNFGTFPKPAISTTAGVQNQRLVIVFNAPGRPLPRDICQRTSQIGAGVGAAAGSTVDASAVYCGGADPYSSAWVSVPTPGGPETAEFRDAMATLVRDAIPRREDPSKRNSNNTPGLPG
ncbi:MAG: hypothetical protein K0Q70_545 [Rhodospirillales bacterium]|jgi:hypothetical protein|nr:hypothetical protein [Rhodospirillales bacterium]